jgi:hypothetical protein
MLCITIFVYDNSLWRNKLGYERSATAQEKWDVSAVEELEWVIFEGKALVESSSSVIAE